MSKYQFTYYLENKPYLVIVTKKRMRSINYRFRNNMFLISCPPLTTQSHLIKGLDKYAPKLVKSDVRSQAFGENYLYLFGQRVDIASSGVINFTNGENITYKNQDDLSKKLRKLFLKVVTNRVRYYESIMGIKPYNVRARKMVSRYGSNSSYTRTITFSTILLHFSIEIVDSVIVHELAHDRIRDHSSNFYNEVYRYCQNYDELHTKLRKGVFQ